MSNIAIKVENLGKKYVINHEKGNGNDNFREVIIGNIKKIISSLNPLSKASKSDDRSTTEEFWALDDVNFTINKGDKVGIIGRNGAGKSTLLKVLSRITEPTTGKIHINGRIASLLEVGTGFHPELTGRENIYLNGAILGMSRKEIKEKFDEIVAFAEVDKFLDTPVKRYSSGMYVRLAFSVAAHLEPEILVVDEVLAVGDAAFQKKCLGKMGEVSKEGRTILFVSHNIEAVRTLCNKGILLNQGKQIIVGDIGEVVSNYLNNSALDTNVMSCRKQKFDKIEILDVELIQDQFQFNRDIELKVKVKSYQDIDDCMFSLSIVSEYGHMIGTTFGESVGSIAKYVINSYYISIPPSRIAPGRYSINIAIGEGKDIGKYVVHDCLFDIVFFHIYANQQKKDFYFDWKIRWGGLVINDLQIKKI